MVINMPFCGNCGRQLPPEARFCPNEDANQRASGLFQNLCAGRIPDSRVPELVGQMLLLNPYADDRVQYIQQHFGRDEETAAILDYFSA